MISLRPLPVLLVFLSASALMLLMAYHQLAALKIGAAGFAAANSQFAGRARAEAADGGFFAGSFESATDNREKKFTGPDLIGFPCGPGAEPPTKACREVIGQIEKIDKAGDGYVASVLLVVAEQMTYVLLAMLAVMLSLLVTILLAVFIDYFAEGLGLRAVSDLLNRIVETIPYTIWLVLAAAAFGPIIASYGIQNRSGMSLYARQAILHGQGVVYLGVSLLLMPLFLNFLLETLRTARRTGLFDMVAMDGLRSGAAYTRVIFGNSRPILYKAILFGTQFVLLFDPIFERLSSSRAVNEAGQIDGIVPLQAFQSPLYQWALLRFDDPRNPLFDKLSTKDMNHQLWTLAQRTGHSATILPITGPAAHEARTAARVAIEFQVFPALMLDSSRWRTLTADANLCEKLEVCKAVADSGAIGDEMARFAIRSSYASAYYFAIMAMLLAMIGALTSWEFWKNYDRRMEQV